ncbi:MAG: tellurite resistance TerB family protein [Gammaproteobacteria bacterium]
MFDAGALINQFLGAGGGDAVRKGKEYLSENGGGLAGGAVMGGLAGYLLGSKSGRKIAKNAATYGGMALVAGLAYKAYSGYRANQQGGQPVTKQTLGVPASAHDAAVTPTSANSVGGETLIPESEFQVDDPVGADGFGAVLVSAMIAAAKADGHIDGPEQQAIFNKINELNLDNEQKAFLFDQLNRPLDIDTLVAAAKGPEQAIEIYVASVLAIDPDTPAEQAYLAMLAARLSLEPGLVEEIHRTVRQAEE